jgi:predicted RNA binding protein YcfA (HicA-like mRNA interferase family)
MKSVSGKELCQTLERHGWCLMRVHGSHHIYGRSGSIVRISVPVHANHTLKRGLFLHLLKCAGIQESEM